MHLLIIMDAPAIGGAENLMLLLVGQWRRRGVEITVVTQLPQLRRHFSGLGAETQNLPFRLDIIGNYRGLVKTFSLLPYAFFWYWRLLTRLKKTGKVDLILLPAFTEKLLISRIAKILAIPVVWFEYGPLSPIFSRNFGLPRFIYRVSLPIPKKIVTISENSLQDINRQTDAGKKVVLVYPGVKKIPDKKFKNLKEEAVAKIKELGLDKGPVIGCVSRLGEEKGQDLLVRAFSKVIVEFPEATLLLIGEGAFETELKILVHELKLGGKVKFLGFRRDKEEILAAMDVFVFPTRFKLEGFGLVAAEAMMMAKPVVATRLGPSAEIIDDGQTGFLVEPESPSSLAQAILRLLRNKEEAALMGERGRKKALKEYDIKRTAERTYQLLWDSSRY